MRPKTAPSAEGEDGGGRVKFSPSNLRPSTSTKTARMSTNELTRLKKKYNKDDNDQFLYGVKLDPSVSTSVYSDNSLPSSPTHLRAIPGGHSKPHPRSRKPGAPLPVKVDPSTIPTLPRPRSPEVLTMLKTLMTLGGVTPVPPPSMSNTHATDKTIDLYDDQRVALEKLKVLRGDRRATTGLRKVLAKKRQIEGRSLDPKEWDDHLPTYARRTPKSRIDVDLSIADAGAPMSAAAGRAHNIKLVLDHIASTAASGLKLEGSPCMTPAVGKTRCALCSCYFSTASMGAVISMKSVQALRSTWGLKENSKRDLAPSFMYQKVRLCRFCGQMFKNKNSKDQLGGHGVNIFREIELDVLKSKNEIEQVMERNLAVGGSAAQSSTADGLLATIAIDGGTDMHSRTRREFEAWWECTLDNMYPIKSIIVHKKDDGKYKMNPFWIFVTAAPLSTLRVNESKRHAIAAAMVDDDGSKITWKLPKNTVAGNVRIQVEGVKSLQLAQVEIIKGGIEGDIGAKAPVALSELKASKMMTTTTFSFDFIGGKKRSATRATAKTSSTSARPRTAPSPTRVGRIPRRKAAPVTSLYQSTDVAYRQKKSNDQVLNNLLSSFHLSEIEAIQRAFLHFANANDVPHNTGDDLQPLLDSYTLHGSSTADAIIGLKSAGTNGPRSRKKEIFGFWEKDPTHEDDNGPHETASPAYISVIESFIVDEMPSAFRDIEYEIGEVRVTWPIFMNVLGTVMKRDLRMLAKIFNVSASAVRGKHVDMHATQRLSPPGTPVHSAPSEEKPFRMPLSPSFEDRLRPRTTGGSRDKNAPTLSLSQSLKFYNNASATYSDSPAPLRKPKKTKTGKSKLQRSEEDFMSLTGKLAGEVEEKLTGYEYVEELERRRERMAEIHKNAEKPTLQPALNRKNCSLCLLSFPLDAMVTSCTVKCLKNLSKRWGVEFQKFGLGVSDTALLMQHRVPVCAFCAQFFDPDDKDGLATFKEEKRRKFEIFFDDAYPERYSRPEVMELKSDYVIKAQRRSSMAVVDKMQFYNAYLDKSASYRESENLRVSEQNSLATDNSRDDHNKAVSDWSDIMHTKEDRLEHSGPELLPDFSSPVASMHSAKKSKEEDTEYLNPVLDSGASLEEINAEDAAYLASMDNKFSAPEGNKMKENDLFRGTVRVPKGRKAASTGISVYEFAAQQEKEKAHAHLSTQHVIGVTPTLNKQASRLSTQGRMHYVDEGTDPNDKEYVIDEEESEATSIVREENSESLTSNY